MTQSHDATAFRTHECGHIGLSDVPNALYRLARVDDEVRVSGWVNSIRDHGELIFVDLRDRTGIVQLVIDPSDAKDAHAVAETMRNEFCVMATGKVVKRSTDLINPNLATGAVEIRVDHLEVLSTCEVLPFQLDDDNVNEEARLRWRFLDLRRQKMFGNLQLRSHVTQVMRRYLDARGFLDVETPILTKSTPEGARDFLVPARKNPGHFYALPQSPQLFKQMLMVAGVERYYQIARCFRDEDLRADRQLEFTQLDVEMSYVSQDDVLDLMEGLMKEVWREVAGVDMHEPFIRLPFHESMLRFGSDKPDLRYDLEIADLSVAWANTDFGVARGAIDAGGAVRVLAAPGGGRFSRKDMDEHTEFAKQFGAKGLAWFIVEEDGSLRSPVTKFLSEDEQHQLKGLSGAAPGDAIFLMADTDHVVSRVLGALRTRLIEVLELEPLREWQFAWIVDAPLFEWDEERNRFTFAHHPFCQPTTDTVGFLKDEPGKVIAEAYDLTLNGWELASGSIRVHQYELQQRIFEVLGISAEEAEEKFSFFLRALKMGAPPHGGIAPGVDRIVALLARETNIREVIAFPRQQSTFDPLTESPSFVDAAQLDELHLRTVMPPVPAAKA
ncbi:MAG: aspartyl-tRNA synthetase [Thermoleophilia bacterium]|nr:aspartyl-tRNA synthetase [Thermoleophilia bacterium]